MGERSKNIKIVESNPEAGFILKAEEIPQKTQEVIKKAQELGADSVFGIEYSAVVGIEDNLICMAYGDAYKIASI